MDWNTPQNKQLIQAFLALKTSAEVQRFLRDLMTEGEIDEFAKRLSAAQMLSENIPYSAIEEKTGLSSTTVARVSKWLHGTEGGYRSILGKLHHRHTSSSAKRGVS